MNRASLFVLAALVLVAAGALYLWLDEEGARGARTSAEPAARAAPEPPPPLAPLGAPPEAHGEAHGEARVERAAAPVASAPGVRVEPTPPPERPARASLVMRFVDAQGAPFPGVVVAPRWAEKESETSGPDGRVEIQVSPDGDESEWSVALFARRTGCATRLLRATATIGRTTDLGDVLLEPGSQLSGRVLDEQGLPIEGAQAGLATVALFDEANGEEWDETYVRRQGTQGFDRTRTATSDASGAFVLEGVPAGALRLWAHAPDRRYGWSEPFEVRAGEDLFALEVRLPALLATDRITGIVLDPAGAPLPRARLVSTYQTENETSSTTSNVGEDGRFELVLRRDALYSFIASDPEHRHADAILLDVAAGARDVELRLAEKRTFTVAVRDRAGLAVEACRFSLGLSVGGMHTNDDSPPKRLEPGLYALGLPTRTFRLEVESDGYLPAHFDELRPEAVGARLEVVLERAPRVRGRVVAEGKPVPGARVSLHRAVLASSYWRNGFACLYPFDAESEGTTDLEGRFELACKSLEPVWLRAASQGWAASDLGPIDPAAGSDPADELRIELTTGGAIEGQVLLPDGADAAGVVVGISHGDGHARTLRAGPEGRFRFEHLTPGRWQVLRRDEELDPSFTTVGSGSDPVEIKWSCTVEAGRVTRHDLDLTRE